MGHRTLHVAAQGEQVASLGPRDVRQELPTRACATPNAIDQSVHDLRVEPFLDHAGAEVAHPMLRPRGAAPGAPVAVVHSFGFGGTNVALVLDAPASLVE